MRNILVPIDFSDVTASVVAHAREQARAFGATVRLLHVAPPDPAFASSVDWPQEVRDGFARELQAEHRDLEAIAERLRAAGVETKALLTRGAVVDSILELAASTDTDLIVMGAHAHGTLAQFLPRSVVKNTVRRANCAVLVVPHAADDPEPPGEDA